MADVVYSKNANAKDHISDDGISGSARQRLRLVADAQGGAKPRGLLSGVELKSGYLPKNEVVDQVFNRTMAALFIVLTSPLFLFVMLLQKLTAKGEIFYKGARYGKDKKLFYIYKFRTLQSGANKMTSKRTLPRRSNSETKLGLYLRASRLDELPQLLNILRGEMVFFGPRPIRPELEWYYANEVPQYETRFAVRPGLVGLAQAVMTHETPKAVRSRFNRMCCRTYVNYPRMMAIVGYVGICVMRKSVLVAGQAVRDMLSPLGGHRWLRSGFTSPPKSRVEMVVDDKTQVGALLGISDEVIQFVSTVPFPLGKTELTLVRQRRKGRITRVRIEAVVQAITPVGLGKPGYAHYATYLCRSQLSVCMVERYFLQSAVVPS